MSVRAEILRAMQKRITDAKRNGSHAVMEFALFSPGKKG